MPPEIFLRSCLSTALVRTSASSHCHVRLDKHDAVRHHTVIRVCTAFTRYRGLGVADVSEKDSDDNDYNLVFNVTLHYFPGGAEGSLVDSALHVDLIEALQLWNTSYRGLTLIPGPRPFAPAVFLQGGAEGSLVDSALHVDLIEALQLWNTSYRGLTLIPGPRPFAPAVFLQGEERLLKLPEAVRLRTSSILSTSREFTVMATLQQEERNAGTILAFSKGLQRLFELQSSGRKDELRLHYVHNGMMHVELFPYKLADRRWHKVAVVVSGGQMEVWVDCRRVFRRLIPPPMTDFSVLEHGSPPLETQNSPAEDPAYEDATEASLQSDMLRSFKGADLAASETSRPTMPTISPQLNFEDEPITLYLGQRNSKHFLFKLGNECVNNTSGFKLDKLSITSHTRQTTRHVSHSSDHSSRLTLVRPLVTSHTRQTTRHVSHSSDHQSRLTLVRPPVTSHTRKIVRLFSQTPNTRDRRPIDTNEKKHILVL
ncbi:Concanavalin A-like lectin/glucanase domain [Trinorchestia longiramus]|nr:Concanavalin A-like lectin/glucanase domain [Trinorchestia longiramus]